MVKKILEAIYEVDFLDFSYGFRPNKSCQGALDRLDKMIAGNKVNYIIDADIKGFFDNVNHNWMVKCLEQRVSDKSLIRLIVRILKGGVMEEGNFSQSEKGTPQGGILSPLLANIYLHYVLDLWLEKVVKKNCKGFVGIVRYADDFVICVQSEIDAKRILSALRKRMCRFGLELAEEKTKIIGFGRKVSKDDDETFNFLGFTHFNDKTRRGNYKVGRKTEKKRFTKALKEMNSWLRSVRNAVKVSEWWSTLKAKLRGYYAYYGVSGNMRWLNKYKRLVEKQVFKWLNRMRQKRQYSWNWFIEYRDRFPLPKPKIYCNLYYSYSY